MSSLYCVTRLAPLSSVYRHCASACPARSRSPAPSPTAIANRFIGLSCWSRMPTAHQGKRHATVPASANREVRRAPQGLRPEGFLQAQKGISQVGPQATRARSRASASGPSNCSVRSPTRAAPSMLSARSSTKRVAGRGEPEPVEAELIDARIRLRQPHLARDDHRVEPRLERPARAHPRHHLGAAVRQEAGAAAGRGETSPRAPRPRRGRRSTTRCRPRSAPRAPPRPARRRRGVTRSGRVPSTPRR